VIVPFLTERDFSHLTDFLLTFGCGKSKRRLESDKESNVNKKKKFPTSDFVIRNRNGKNPVLSKMGFITFLEEKNDFSFFFGKA